MNKKSSVSTIDTQLELLREQTRIYLNRVVERGGKLTTYKCSHCNESIQTVQPKENEVASKGYWDSAKTCTNCGKLNFVFTWPSGKTKVNSITV